MFVGAGRKWTHRAVEVDQSRFDFALLNVHVQLVHRGTAAEDMGRVDTVAKLVRTVKVPFADRFHCVDKR